MNNKHNLQELGETAGSWENLENRIFPLLKHGDVISFNNNGYVMTRCINNAFDELGEEVAREQMSKMMMSDNTYNLPALLEQKTIELSKVIANHYEGEFDE